MNSYDPNNEYDILLRIFRFVRDYSTETCTITKVCRELIKDLKSSGHDVETVDVHHRDFRIIQVNGHRYKIIRYPEWTRYDVIRTT